MVSLTETLRGIVQRVTYHNPDNGWSVLRVQPFNSIEKQETVTVHQTKVFAGATMEFRGTWTTHPKFGRQFKAVEAIEKNRPPLVLLRSIWAPDSLKELAQRLQKR